jgi:hypothetical protein
VCWWSASCVGRVGEVEVPCVDADGCREIGQRMPAVRSRSSWSRSQAIRSDAPAVSRDVVGIAWSAWNSRRWVLFAGELRRSGLCGLALRACAGHAVDRDADAEDTTVAGPSVDASAIVADLHPGAGPVYGGDQMQVGGAGDPGQDDVANFSCRIRLRSPGLGGMIGARSETCGRATLGAVGPWTGDDPGHNADCGSRPLEWCSG